MPLEVIHPGPATTVQDIGRPGFGACGVPEGGAMDRGLLASANRAVGNQPGTAALEFGLKGPRLRWRGRGRMRVAIAGDETSVVALASGEEFDCGSLRWSAYGYVAVAGGIEVPRLMGSRGTCLPGKFGGLEGRTLIAGDELAVGQWQGPGTRSKPSDNNGKGDSDGETRARGTELRVIRVAGAGAWEQLLAEQWRVVTGNRVGLRLQGSELSLMPLRLSQPIPPGAIQVTGSGMPILLLRDHPTVGGYPVVAVVTTEDLDAACQVRPGSVLRFRSAEAEE